MTALHTVLHIRLALHPHKSNPGPGIEYLAVQILALLPLIATLDTLVKKCCWFICRPGLYLVEVGLMVAALVTSYCTNR